MLNQTITGQNKDDLVPSNEIITAPYVWLKPDNRRRTKIFGHLGRVDILKPSCELCIILDIRKNWTNTRNPKCNGRTERFNRSMISMIKSYFRGEQTNCDINLGCLAVAYRASPNESTCLTPNILMLGMEMSSQIRISKRGLADRCLRCTPVEEAYVAKKSRMEAHIYKRHLALEVAPYFFTLCMYRCESLKTLYRHVDTFMPHVNQRNACMAENRFKEDTEYLYTSVKPHQFNVIPGFPDYEVLPAAEFQKHWVSKVRARPLATTMTTLAQPLAQPALRVQAPVRTVALPATHPNQKTSSYNVLPAITT
ncbi:unnamed protein product [Mytilus coruscus]|uniref:Integrase catalytic domain-containing protein n=1 Tax=Mytilus coruscus TaxID=42192 RepID=A0A6J8ENU4_MYTCO|nr:unnamed protein product [Mytilus coruscus]